MEGQPLGFCIGKSPAVRSRRWRAALAAHTPSIASDGQQPDAPCQLETPPNSEALYTCRIRMHLQVATMSSQRSAGGAAAAATHPIAVHSR